MDFAWIKTFVTAAKFENFRQTAETLFISQPTVTVHIRLLEEALGIPLFERVGRKIQLTLEGKRFEHHAKHLLKVYHEGLEDLQGFRQGYVYKLTLAISPLIADTILPAVLKRYLKHHGDVELNIKVMESKDIEDLILNGTVDIGISCLNTRNTTLHCDKLHEDSILLIVPHDGYDLESGPPIEEEEILSKYHLLTDSHPDYWNDLLPTIKRTYPFVKTMKVSQVHITKRFIIEGLGASYLPASTVRRELLEGRMMEIQSEIPLPTAKTFAIYKYDHDIIREFLSFITQFHY
ncbi:LysR family transcriptional regulator [Salirhabdus sp. Marseille-P4669]|uniref:LysR family transcriptional regulator n=1 Tax=Salirhabdus sp. Marseille-P4669 TaxID=2042310 RepID=UPI000C7A0C64|nr:LysR family transcriptional regulator [Salirhabdus sp. Marseille-P4669]